MKTSKAEALQRKLDRLQERLLLEMEQVKALKKEIADLIKAKEAAEMEELQSYMRAYDISPQKARALMEQMREKEALEHEETNDALPADSNR